MDRTEHDIIRHYADLCAREEKLRRRGKYRLATLLSKWESRLSLFYRVRK